MAEREGGPAPRHPAEYDDSIHVEVWGMPDGAHWHVLVTASVEPVASRNPSMHNINEPYRRVWVLWQYGWRDHTIKGVAQVKLSPEKVVWKRRRPGEWRLIGKAAKGESY